jgi:SAM-dependent methyltransferase
VTDAGGMRTVGPDRQEARAIRRAAQADAYDRISGRFDAVFSGRAAQVAATRWLLTQVAPGDAVLDVGCGTGLPSGALLSRSGCVVTGIDISPAMLRLAHRNMPTARLLELDVLDLGPQVGTFAGAVVFFTLLALPRDQLPAALRAVMSVLQPGAPVVFGMVEGDIDDLPVPLLGAEIRASGYLRDDLVAVLHEVGYVVETLETASYAPASTLALPELQLFAYCRAPRAAGEAPPID